ncbi:outer membrane protein [Falsirhodobacter sp. 20TX0035]|uniref:outer membrane protein n=1 Tax=Falsirhodobacter sp. 20TX0035 TaxID=3022019 RepID=UPI00232DAFEE|nr:outer membrane beta-barrel protein [Falsirhodobacter sp. 20TX0035]MDB6453544.1 outer membrane beta-barrel protein [Falsirhodobacter sp. 20TX0035]
MMISRYAALGLGFVALTATPLFAGGPVVPAPEPVIAAPVVMTTSPMFAGGYAGAGLGYSFGGSDTVGVRPFSDDVGEIELNGPSAELHAGYRWQQPGSNWVYGLEGQVAGGDISDETEGSALGIDFETESKIKWTAELRGTLGYAVRPNTLLYGFAGYTVGRSEYNIRATDGVATENLDQDENLDGYVAGLGLERLLNDRWSLRGEYKYTNLGKEDLDSENDIYTTSDTPEYHTINVGFNYRF